MLKVTSIHVRGCTPKPRLKARNSIRLSQQEADTDHRAGDPNRSPDDSIAQVSRIVPGIICACRLSSGANLDNGDPDILCDRSGSFYFPRRTPLQSRDRPDIIYPPCIAGSSCKGQHCLCRALKRSTIMAKPAVRPARL